jgi:iron complex outermembrane receptor protein
MKDRAAYRCGVAAGALTLALLAAGSPALAQTAPSAPTSPETTADTVPDAGDDIVVTAQFRAQNLQDTPLSITALSASGLEARSYSRVTDITDAAPNVVIKPAGAAYGPAAQIFIRGIGQADSNFALEPGVGTYIDDVYYGTLYGANFDLLDLDRVEILRGPQGTLAGKNSLGGAIKLYTRKPDGKGDSFVEASYGSRNLLNFRAGADITLVPDTLFARLSGVFNRQDGYVQRLDYGCLHPGSGIAAAGATQDCKLGREGGKNYAGGRLALRWLAGSGVEVNLSSTLVRDTSEAAASVLLGVASNGVGFFNGTDPNLFITPPGAFVNYATYQTPGFTDPAIYAGRPGAGTHPTTSVPDHIDLLSSNSAASIDIDLGGGIALKSVTGYSYTRTRYGVDLDTTPISINQFDFRASSRQVSQELRLSGDLSSLIDWTLGGYYYRAHNHIGGSNFLFTGRPFENLNSPDDDIISENKSAFAQLIIHPAAGLNLTGGLRYTDDSKDYVYRRYNPFLPGVPTFTPAGALTGTRSHYQSDRLDYRVSVDYRWSDALLTYAQISTGFRGGGTNPRPFVPEQAVAFFPETLTAYEIGFKSDVFDRKLRLNVAAFINDYSNIIFTNNAPTPTSASNATPTNIGTATFKGVEAELTARPVEGLLIDASASYLGFKLKSFTGAGLVIPGVSLATRAPFAPEWKVSAGVQYAAETGIGTITPRIDYAYQSAYFTGIDNSPFGKVPGYGIFNARLSWDSSDKSWRVSVAAKNLTDKLYYLGKFFVNGLSLGQPAPPREVSVTLRRKF